LCATDDNLREADWGLRGATDQPDSRPTSACQGNSPQEPAALPLKDLHRRHPGLTEAVARYYIEAAAVCLDRHHDPPVVFGLYHQELEYLASVDWEVTDTRIRSAWANSTDATEAGAYACAIAATELSRGLVAIGRAETLTGADYYVGLPGQNADDLENCFRLEVSGTDLGTLVDIRARMRAKLEQVAAGKSNLPALAAVVGFRCRIISLGDLESK
jgi:hypothetical protein